MAQSYAYTLKQFETEAAEIVSKARDAARQILKRALEETGRLKEEARVEGHQKGLEEGRVQGRTEAERRFTEETRTVVEALQAVIKNVEDPKRRLIHQAQRDLVALSMTIAEVIVRARIEFDPSIAQRAVDEAIQKVGRRRTLKVHLNPVDHAAIKLPSSDAVEFLVDPAVSRGGCVIKGDATVIDAKVETQLKNIKEALLG